MNTPIIDNQSARFEAQRLAFAPLMFQAARVLRDTGLLEEVARARSEGLTAHDGAERCAISRYAAEVLLEAGLASGLCTLTSSAKPGACAPRFCISRMGTYWLRDALTRVNAEFIHRVCYRGAFHLREALLEGRPAGLCEIDRTGAATVYEALRALPPDVREAWFDFDHFYSDGVFEACVGEVLGAGPVWVVDIGANTGRFAKLCLARGAHVTLVDLPGQLASAADHLTDVAPDRFELVPVNLLDPDAELPAGADVYWLSQVLDCFAEDEVRSILERVRRAMKPSARCFILETFWDHQRHEASRYCVIGTSLYFACIANGNSRMYSVEVMKRLIGEAGLVVAVETPAVGLAHTLLTCARR